MAVHSKVTKNTLDSDLSSFRTPTGPQLLDRLQPFFDYYQQRRDEQTWFYTRTINGAPGRTGELRCVDGQTVKGLNFGSQDYLSLGSHPRVREAAIRAIETYGVHSAGSPCVQGNTPLSEQLEREISDLVQMPHVILFPTGWAAGYASVFGLIRPDDHIVMDRYSHNCLQSGAYASTKKIHRFHHNDAWQLRTTLKDIRASDTQNAILVITEGIFSQDSDTPDLVEMQNICHEYGATLLVDVAHDLGALGPDGTGALGEQGLLSKVDLVMGSFSKTFASNGGFLASRSEAVTRFVKYYGGSHMFSNALSPAQTSAVLEAIRIVRSPEGNTLRQRLMENVNALREAFAGSELLCMGRPSAIVPVLIGDELIAREMHRRVSQQNIIIQFFEFPVVGRGKARIRMQVMANHTPDDTRQAAEAIIAAFHQLQ